MGARSENGRPDTIGATSSEAGSIRWEWAGTPFVFDVDDHTRKRIESGSITLQQLLDISRPDYTEYGTRVDLREQNAEIRAWARKNGWPDIGDRGPLGKDIKRKFAWATGIGPIESTEANAPEIRSWARQNGFDVKDRGRIPAEIIDAFNHRDTSE